MSDTVRFLEVAWAVVVLFLAAIREQVHRTPPDRSTLPLRLRATLERLGPV